MVINFTVEQTRKLELLTLWRGNEMSDKEAIAALLLRLVDAELGKARISTPTQPEKGASTDVKGA